MPKFAGSAGLLISLSPNGLELRVALIRLELSRGSIDTAADISVQSTKNICRAAPKD
jgi:hypothetical protein